MITAALALIAVLQGVERYRVVTRWWVWRQLISATESVGGVELRHRGWIPRLRGRWRGTCTAMIPASVLSGSPSRLPDLADALGRLTRRVCVYGGRQAVGRSYFDVFELRR